MIALNTNRFDGKGEPDFFLLLHVSNSLRCDLLLTIYFVALSCTELFGLFPTRPLSKLYFTITAEILARSLANCNCQ